MNAGSVARVLGISVTLVVLSVIVVGIVLLESPAHQRQRKLDAHRVQDLIAIQNAINVSMIRKKSLPPDLATLATEAGLHVEVADPQTKTPYEYEVLGPTSYRLCAVFETDSADEAQTGYYVGPVSWAHGAGRNCFELRTPK
ncbi:MAG TPA: hypothetical protein VED47_09985 [Burkholderiaceae bacterium]|nr:hypothetical protein [Burkholderiaceae bacterium]